MEGSVKGGAGCLYIRDICKHPICQPSITMYMGCLQVSLSNHPICQPSITMYMGTFIHFIKFFLP